MSKVVVVTGAGGVLCSRLAKAMAKQGYKIAVLDLKIEAAQVVASDINESGGTAIGVMANVLEKASLEAAKAEINEKLGPCDILINGAGGNHPLGTTSNPYLLEADMKNTAEGFKTFGFFCEAATGILLCGIRIQTFKNSLDQCTYAFKI